MKTQVLALVLALAWALVGCEKSTPAPGPAAVNVVATIFPLADVISNIGGPHVRVQTMLAPGQSPHQYQQSFAQAQMLAGAQLLIRVGLGIDDWAMRPAKNAKVPILTLAEAANYMRQESVTSPAATTSTAPASAPHDSHDEHAHDEHAEDSDHDHDAHDHAHDHGGLDPHVWLDPVFMQAFARRIADELIRIDPANEADYQANLESYLRQLQQLDADYREQLSALPSKAFVTFHPAFTYVADRYGLEQMSLQDVGAGGAGFERIERVRDFIRSRGVRAIFVEPQFPAQRIEQLASGTGAKVGVLDPLGRPGREGYDSYIAMMRSNLRSLVENLGATQ